MSGPVTFYYQTSGYGKQYRATFSAPTGTNDVGWVLDPTPIWAAGDVLIVKDDTAPGVNVTNLPVQVTVAMPFYRILLTATEMEAFKVSVILKPAGNARGVHLRIDVSPMPNALTRGTLAGGTASTFTLPATDFDNTTTSVVNNFYTNAQITIVGGTGANQTRPIASYVGATRIGTVARDWTTAPDGTSVYVLGPGADVWDIMEGSEPSGPIASNATFRQILQYSKRYFFNRNTQTAVLRTTYKDDSTTVLATRASTSDGITQELAKQA